MLINSLVDNTFDQESISLFCLNKNNWLVETKWGVEQFAHDISLGYKLTAAMAGL